MDEHMKKVRAGEAANVVDEFYEEVLEDDNLECGDCGCLVLEDEEKTEDMCEVNEAADDWVCETILMDSGAGASVLRDGAPQHVPVAPVSNEDMKKRWAHASGGEIK